MAQVDNCKYSNISASAAVKSAAGTLYGIVVNSHTIGTLKLWDNTAGSGTVIFNTITFASGPNFINFPQGISFNTGLYATIGGTADITILYF